MLPAAEEADAEAGDDTGTPADVGADDDVSAVGRTASGILLGSAGGAVGVDGQGRAGGVADCLVADAEIEDGVFDVELDGRGFALELDELVAGAEWVYGGFEEVVARISIEVAVGLGEGDQLRGAPVGV